LGATKILMGNSPAASAAEPSMAHLLRAGDPVRCTDQRLRYDLKKIVDLERKTKGGCGTQIHRCFFLGNGEGGRIGSTSTVVTRMKQVHKRKRKKGGSDRSAGIVWTTIIVLEKEEAYARLYQMTEK